MVFDKERFTSHSKVIIVSNMAIEGYTVDLPVLPLFG
jgi:hypothetical protein